MLQQERFQLADTLHPKRSMFDLSYAKIFNCEMGQLIPVLHDMVLPGDIWEIGNEVVVRFTPLVAPVLHEIWCDVDYYFVPFRLLTISGDTGDWEGFITGGEDGADTSVLPRWENHSDTALYSLWDYFGFPTGVTVPASWSMAPISYLHRAYNMVYNEYYRDQWIQSEINIDTSVVIKRRNWSKDYFTAGLTSQQRGTAPSLPLSGTTNAEWGAASASNQTTVAYDSVANDPYNAGSKGFLENNTVDFSGATTFDIADLRLAFQTQVWLERNARIGGRYVEQLKARWGIGDTLDARLDRPELIGTTRQSIIVSEVLNTSSTATEDQGHLAGHGLSADSGFACRYRFLEHGVVIGILSIMPKPCYGQGINRQWLYTSKYDFPHPEFMHLSERYSYKAEIYMDGSATDDDPLSYQGIYDEHRVKHDLYAGDMRSTFDYWHLGRQFASVPSHNNALIECDPRTDIFASTSEPGCIVHIGNRIKALRPLPFMAIPGKIDH